MKRAILMAGLFSFVMTQACRLLVERDKRPAFHGRNVTPVWKAEGIQVDHLAACEAPVLLAVSTDGRLIALDAADGHRLWQADPRVDRIVACGKQSALILTGKGKPARLVNLADGRLLDETPYDLQIWSVDSYYGFSGQGVVAVDERGHEVIRGAGSYSGKIAAKADVLGVLGPARLTVFDRKTLRLLWAKPFGAYSHLLMPSEGGAIFVRDYRIGQEGDASIISAIDARSGAEKWKRTEPGEMREEDGLLGLSSGALLIQKPWKGYSIARADHSLWRNQTPYFITGIDPETGRDLFTTAMYARAEGKGGILASGGMLYSRDHKQYSLEDEAGNASKSSWLTSIDPKTGAELWRSKTEDEVAYSPPVVGGNLVFIGGRGRATAGVLAFRISSK